MNLLTISLDACCLRWLPCVKVNAFMQNGMCHSCGTLLWLYCTHATPMECDCDTPTDTPTNTQNEFETTRKSIKLNEYVARRMGEIETTVQKRNNERKTKQNPKKKKTRGEKNCHSFEVAICSHGDNLCTASTDLFVFLLFLSRFLLLQRQQMVALHCYFTTKSYFVW